jgi:hypothetical protein
VSYIIYYGNKTKEADIDVYRGREERENLDGSGLKSQQKQAMFLFQNRPDALWAFHGFLFIVFWFFCRSKVAQGLIWLGINLARS